MKLKRTHIIIAIFCLLGLTAIECHANNNERQHIEVIVRKIGHEFLLQLGDSTSRILPIEKVEGRYKIQFEKELSFEPDLLSFAAFKVVEETKLSENYIVEVENCETHDVVHSFEVTATNRDNLIPCKQRALPKNCYTVFFTILDLSEEVVVTEKLTEKEDRSIFYLTGVLIIFIGIVIYFFIKRKSSNSDSNIIEIGKYRFDRKGMKLVLKSESIELSSKEADLLSLLYANENKTLERDYILNVVWGDEGDYVGRTLDVFISKLRKKLESDPNIKIVNVRGVGYRFVI